MACGISLVGLICGDYDVIGSDGGGGECTVEGDWNGCNHNE